MKTARYYRGARTAHLERLHDFEPGDFLYMKAMYDFDLTQAPSGQTVRRVGLGFVLRQVWNGAYETLEIVEPYAPSALPQNILIAVTHCVARSFRGSRTRLVTYAIENADLVAKYSSRLHLPRAIVRWGVRATVGLSYRSLSRVAFGTQAAERNYRDLLGDRAWARQRPERTVIPGLSSPRVGAADSAVPEARRLVFLGAFDDRKGLRQLLDAWPDVKSALPEAELLVVGKGPLLAWVEEQAARLSDVDLVVDPPRERIWDHLNSARALVLLSQPTPEWREQIGLPILEGLSVGLEIIASEETGIAVWLADQGHRVISPGAPAATISATVVAALTETRSRADVIEALPDEDGRLLADRWLHRRET